MSKAVADIKTMFDFKGDAIVREDAKSFFAEADDSSRVPYVRMNLPSIRLMKSKRSMRNDSSNYIFSFCPPFN